MSELNSTNGQHNGEDDDANVITLKGMYKDYFLDYASYVILERAVPALEDGLKPVQRRILHALKEMDDGRYNKVANIIGQTMQYHPHGDASIGDAMVNIGQKDLLIDPQGNWGDARTGDRAAASRYIEARLTKFALDVAFNSQTTDWQVSYDGRKREPINLPVKFPLLLSQGVEGIAVGLSTKVMPHNFIELLKASIKILEDKPFKIYPDFQTGGLLDVSEYNKGKRGGKIKVRARINRLEKNTLVITELPYGVTTTQLAESIVKANDKGKIKIKKVEDITAADVEIRVELASGVSPDVTIDALYAFTNCEVSVSPNACVILDNKPLFTDVHEILKISTFRTKDLLGRELEIKQGELEERLHFMSLEKIFIQNRVYHEIEEAETWEAVVSIIDTEMRKYILTPNMKAAKNDKRVKLLRDLTENDITRLTEIRIKRISKYNAFKADEKIAELEAELAQVKHDLIHLTEFAINYFQGLLDKYGKGRERRTEITSFETIERAQVVANNAKLYANLKEGFVGTGLKKDTFIADCSDIDDIIVFKRDGTFQVVRIADKIFVGKNIEHVAVWQKGDERTTYNMMYSDGKTGRTMAKRFNVKAITRDKDYDLTKGTKGSRMLYFTANPNGESETVSVQLTQACTARVKNLEYDFGELAIKGRASQGNLVTKYPVRKITQLEQGSSTLGALKIYMDEVSGRLNTEDRGKLLGEFDTGDQILAVYKDGTYELTDYELTNRYDVSNLLYINKFDPETVLSAVYWEGEKKQTTVKRFKIETSKTGQKYSFISDHKQSKLYFISAAAEPKIKYGIRVNRKKEEAELNLAEFIDVKGWKAIGNKLTESKIISVTDLTKKEAAPKPSVKKTAAKKTAGDKLKPGDSVDFDLGSNGQKKLF